MTPTPRPPGPPVDLVVLPSWPWSADCIGHRNHVPEGREFAEDMRRGMPNSTHYGIESCECDAVARRATRREGGA